MEITKVFKKITICAVISSLIITAIVAGYWGLAMADDGNGKIMGRVFVDINKNGMLDEADSNYMHQNTFQSVPQWHITLYDTNKTMVLAETDSNCMGLYKIDNIAPGSYVLDVKTYNEYPASTATSVPLNVTAGTMERVDYGFQVGYLGLPVV